MAADHNLNEAIEKAPRAASLVIAIYKALSNASTKAQLEEIIKEIQIYLKGAPQRIYISYGWLLLCTFLV